MMLSKYSICFHRPQIARITILFVYTIFFAIDIYLSKFHRDLSFHFYQAWKFLLFSCGSLKRFHTFNKCIVEIFWGGASENQEKGSAETY